MLYGRIHVNYWYLVGCESINLKLLKDSRIGNFGSDNLKFYPTGVRYFAAVTLAVIITAQSHANAWPDGFCCKPIASRDHHEIQGTSLSTTVSAVILAFGSLRPIYKAAHVVSPG